MKSSLKKSKYLEIAELIMEKIIEGELAPGERIPSVRETAIQMGVTPNTAANAHAQLREMGIIQPVHGKGSIVMAGSREICRTYMEKQFINHEIPLVRQRIDLLGLSEEQLLCLLKETPSLKVNQTEMKK